MNASIGFFTQPAFFTSGGFVFAGAVNNHFMWASSEVADGFAGWRESIAAVNAAMVASGRGLPPTGMRGFCSPFANCTRRLVFPEPGWTAGPRLPPLSRSSKLAMDKPAWALAPVWQAAQLAARI